MSRKTIDILGQEYDIILCTPQESNGLLNEEHDGICDTYLHEIYVTDYVNSDCDCERTERVNANHVGVTKSILRHELIHAILKESGLDSETDFAKNEIMVDWIALQLPKIIKIMIQAGAFSEQEIDTFLKLMKGEE